MGISREERIESVDDLVVLQVGGIELGETRAVERGAEV